MNILEWIAVLFTMASVIMLGKGSIFGWAYGIVGCILYGIVFVEQKLFANAIIQIVFVLQGFYGLYQWDKKQEKEFVSIKFDSTSLLLIFSSTLGIALMLSVFLYSFMSGESPFMDTILSMCSLCAMVMIIKRIVHAWFFWMAIDIGYVFLFLKSDMYVSAGLYLILILLCIKNYIQWNKKTENKII